MISWTEKIFTTWEFIIRENTKLFGVHFVHSWVFLYFERGNIRDVLRHSPKSCHRTQFFFYLEFICIFESVASRPSLSRRSRACMQVQDAACYPRSTCAESLVIGIDIPGGQETLAGIFAWPLTCLMRSAFALSRGRLLEKAVGYTWKPCPLVHLAIMQ